MTVHRNEVIISGRLAAGALPKELPSGDEIVTWRLIVDRTGPGGTRTFDVVDCTAFAARVRRSALRWPEGEVIEVTGSLRRRFWRAPSGVQSRCEVIVDAARRASRTGEPASAPRARRPRTTG